MMWDGMNIVPHPLAREVRDEFRVERAPGRPRRRRWVVKAHRIDRPCAFVMGGTVFMHPDLVAKL